jgi:hypothetical protein
MSNVIQVASTGTDTVTSVFTSGILDSLVLTAPTGLALTLTSIGTQGDPGGNLPAGGTTDQQLYKLSDTSGDYSWTSTLDNGTY